MMKLKAAGKNTGLRLTIAIIFMPVGALVCNGASPITYTVNRTFGSGSITGFIQTDGTTTGSLSAANIVDWNLTENDGFGNSLNLTGPKSGSDSQVIAAGGDLTATATGLFFNFSGSDGGFVAFQVPPLFYGGEYYCLDAISNTTDCIPGESVAPSSFFIVTASRTGNVIIGTSGPSIALVANAEGESGIIAPNTWVEIKGSNLAPPGVSSPACAPGYCWQPSDFVNSRLPTALQGVGVTLNGEKAFVYFISPSQINILTPPDLAAGPVAVQVTNNGSASTTFNAQALTLSESFFVINGGPYVVATHLGSSFCTAPISAVCLVGPSTLYPGYSTPAQRNETIVIYANGFGSTTTQVVSGAETQSGSLPALPVIQIGNATATVTFAGLISPGLYQFNVIVPATVSSGDNTIQATYNGQKTQSGTLLTIQ